MGLRLAVLLAGCLALPALALAAGTDPVKRIDPADQRKAASVILQRADLGAGWRKVSVSPDDVADVACPGFNPDLSNLTVTGEAKATYKKAVGPVCLLGHVGVRDEGGCGRVAVTHRQAPA